jgi:hypothetical protein
MVPMARIPAIVLACALAVLALATAAHASSVRELGEFDDSPFQTADCPADCQAIAQVTGFQSQVGSHHDPLKVPKRGYVVAFTVKLAQPTPDQVAFFNTTYGTPSRVRVAVIRLKHRRQHGFKLYRQSQAFDMSRYFGSTPTIALHTALRVNRGDVVAITVPTWLPAFAHNLGTDMAWRNSHTKANCAAESPPKETHETVGEIKNFECFYRTARVLYSVTFVPDPEQTSTGK